MNANTAAFRWALAGVLFLLYALSISFFIYTNNQVGMSSWDLVFSALLLSVPLLLLYFSIGLLISAGQQRRSEGRISAGMAKYIYLTPRIAGLLIVLFVGAFALDAFGTPGSIWLKIGSFLLHAAPSIFLAVLLALAWRRPQIGFWVFLVAAVFFLRFVLGGGDMTPAQVLGNILPHILLFSGPMALIAALFWANWKWERELRSLT